MTVGELQIVMYHYVRDFATTRYPGIKGLDVRGFRRQLDVLAQRFQIVRMEQVTEAAMGGAPLPEHAALLTFDDGYADHFQTVFPILHERGLQGSFFPPVTPVVDRVILDVNRVHFVLAAAPSAEVLGEFIDRRVAAVRSDDIESVHDYRDQWAHPNRFDDAETIYVKRMLQTALPEDLRHDLARELFATFVSDDEAAFASELYFSPEQARVMVDCGMHLGSHGTRHRWLDRLDRPEVVDEIDGSLEFLDVIGMPVEDGWTMCYPYGGVNDSVVQITEERGASIGLTTEVATALVGQHHRLLLPRYDTNDFPS